MKIAIVHYHLKKGGVTRVIENTVRILNKNGIDSLVLCCELPDSSAYPFDNVTAIPGLAYNDSFSEIAADTLKESLESACIDKWGSLPDVWHVHNHCLAKNLELPFVVSRWAEEGKKLLLQIHDFAEDGRPANYRALLITLANKERELMDSILYPYGEHVHYALLNNRDLSYIKQSGVPENQAHLLPNAINLSPQKQSPKPSRAQTDFADKKLYLYPTRAIRRKNIGELLLWSILAKDNEVFGLTLSPDNPTARPIYEAWESFAQKHKLPVLFELGSKYDFNELIEAAHAIITTSVGEGFGLGFLEPFLANKQLVGRDIPVITKDFKDKGINLFNLYPRIEIPISWIGHDTLRKAIHEGILKYYIDYRQACTKDKIKEAVASAQQEDTVDFARLPEPLQRTVLELLINHPELRHHVIPEKLDTFLPPSSIEKNKNLITDHYQLESYGTQLTSIYQQLANSTSSPPSFLETEKVLFSYLNPSNYTPLRS